MLIINNEEQTAFVLACLYKNDFTMFIHSFLLSLCIDNVLAFYLQMFYCAYSIVAVVKPEINAKAICH